MAIEAIVSDVDNTLFDFMTMKMESSYYAIEKMISRGLPIDMVEGKRMLPEIFRNFTWEDPLLFWHVAQWSGIKDQVSLERYTQMGKIAYRKKQVQIMKPYEGVAETLGALKEKGIQLAILSDAPRLKVFDRLCELEIDQYFENRVVGNDNNDKTKKPSEKAFKNVLSVLQRKSPENVIMVGDHPIRDIRGARNYGFITAWAKYGYHAQKDEDKNSIKTHADYVLEQFSDLQRIVSENTN
jgi:HAD superfamily hydrolase (TIGR01509 family)